MKLIIPKTPTSQHSNFVLLFLLGLVFIQYSQHKQGQDEDLLRGVTSATNTGAQAAQCLSFDDGFNDLISISKRIFITMPPKAAGTSLKQFTSQCMGMDVQDNFMNLGPDARKSFLTDTFRLPKVITSHAYGDVVLIDLIQHTTKDDLLVYVHREESPRLKSALSHVVGSKFCTQRLHETERLKGVLSDVSLLSNNDTDCVIDEHVLVDTVISRRLYEMQAGAPKILTCNAYEKIAETAPRMVFLHYTQADQLQSLIAKHHCPEMLAASANNDNDEREEDAAGPVRANVKKDKKKIVWVQLKADKMVTLDEWMEEKADILEWSLQLNPKQSCQGKTRQMEKALFTCKDEILLV